MNSPKLTLIIIGALFLFISIIHFQMVDNEKKDPYSLQSFKEQAKTDGTYEHKRYAFKKKERISINDASLEDIKSVSGFGEKMAEKVIMAREKAGGKLNEKDILDISGVGEGKLASLKESFIIPPGPAKDKTASLLNSDVSPEQQCPHCNKELSDHNRKDHENYIYCPHCLKYLAEKRKSE